MKKTLLLAGVASILAFNAQAFEIKPVVGLDYVYSIADIDSDNNGNELFDDRLSAYAVSAGVKLNDYVGLEAFYQQSETGHKNVDNGKTKDEYRAYGLDLMGYIPMTNVPHLDLIGSLGLANYKVKGYINAEKATKDKLGFRAGFGLQYSITDHIATRVMARYNDLNISGIDNIIDLTAGIRVYF